MKKVEDATLSDLVEALEQLEELSLPNNKDRLLNGSPDTAVIDEKTKGMVCFIARLASEILKPINGALPGQAFCLLASKGFVARPANTVSSDLDGYAMSTKKGIVLLDFDE